MPAYNEAGGIIGFLEELRVSLKEHEVFFIVVNDSSQDETEKILLEYFSVNKFGKVHTNKANYGHGKSTLIGLHESLKTSADLVVALDGDGQFMGSDIRDMVDLYKEGNHSIIEGARKNRKDPMYRKPISFVTRFIVFVKSSSWPKDANTPLRIYKPEVLRYILSKISDDEMVPNLVISTLTRKMKLPYSEYYVTSLIRRGKIPDGSTWGKVNRIFPNKRLLLFCASAFTQFWKS
jgi:glycosyltransferase involved in cell wall biosynthesis